MQAVIGTIGMVTASTVIQSITSLSSSVYMLMGHIRVTKDIHQTEILKILTKMDIEATINLLHNVILEIPEYYNSSLTVVTALKNVQEIISQIESELIEIHKKISYNSELKIMSNWRSYDCKENLDSIELKVSILDRRRDNLFKVLDVFKNFEKKN
jgi:hypothetical protein